MSFLSSDENREFAEIAAAADKMTRDELVRGDLTGENDYTSAFLSKFRDLVNKSKLSFSARIIKMGGGDEREMGADAAIIINSGRHSKVAVFEAKWPRFKTRGYDWDYKPKSDNKKKKTKPKGRKKSHFSDQLDRQAVWVKKIAVFEIFYSEHMKDETPPFMEAEGSTCLWHDDAIARSRKRPDPKLPWSQGELSDLLQDKKISLPEVIRNFGECKKGQVFLTQRAEVMAEKLRLPDLILAIDVSEEQNPFQGSGQIVPYKNFKVDVSIVGDVAIECFGEHGYAVGCDPHLVPGEPTIEQKLTANCSIHNT